MIMLSMFEFEVMLINSDAGFGYTDTAFNSLSFIPTPLGVVHEPY